MRNGYGHARTKIIQGTRRAKKQELVIKLASDLHDGCRAPREQENSSYEPREKETNDEEWIKKHGTNKVDIANTFFQELPKDWQEKNKAAAEVVMNEVVRAVKSGRKLDNEFIEEVSSIVHDEWLKRHGHEDWVPGELKESFENLPEEEAEKDRVQVRKAIEIFEAGE